MTSEEMERLRMEQRLSVVRPFVFRRGGYKGHATYTRPRIRAHVYASAFRHADARGGRMLRVPYADCHGNSVRCKTFHSRAPPSTELAASSRNPLSTAEH